MRHVSVTTSLLVWAIHILFATYLFRDLNPVPAGYVG